MSFLAAKVLIKFSSLKLCLFEKYLWFQNKAEMLSQNSSTPIQSFFPHKCGPILLK